MISTPVPCLIACTFQVVLEKNELKVHTDILHNTNGSHPNGHPHGASPGTVLILSACRTGVVPFP